MQTTFDLTTTPASPVQRRTALVMLAAIFAIAAFVLPFVRLPLASPAGFTPALCGSLVVMDLVTAALLLRQAALNRRVALVVLAAGFLITGMLIVAYLLAFPATLGALRDSARVQAANWLWVGWHLTLPAALVAYVATSRRTRERLPFAAVIAGALLLGAGAGRGIIAAAPYLPAYAREGAWTPLVPHVIEPLMVLAVGTALAVLATRRFATVLDLWLAVSLVATLLDIVTAQSGGGRFSVGWHGSKIGTLLAHGVVLAALLVESSRVNVTAAGAERRMRSVFEGVADAVIAIDADVRIRFVNPAARELFGYSREALEGLAIADIIPNYAERARGYDGKAAVEAQGRHADGRAFPVEIAFGEGADGERRRTIVIARDITQRKRAEAAIKAARDQAIESANVKAQFLATMSHEIRTPINAVVGMSELLMQSELSGEALDYAKTVRDSAEALLGVINDILDYSQIEAGKMELERRPFSLVGIVENAADICASTARAKGLSLVTHVAPDVPSYAVGDAGRVRQILINLIGNAVKFTSRGEVVVRALVERLDGERVVVRFSVMDTGPGISREHVNRLFEAFTQADGSTRRRFGGTGLGLSISKRLVELMDGEIGVQSTPDLGSTFWFTVPLDRVDDDVVIESRPRTLRGTRVLVIDDDDTSRAILEQYLMNWGLVSTSTANPVHALALLKAAQQRNMAYDVVLVDFVMPGVDGFAFAARIAADPVLSATPLVLVTAHDEPGRGAEALARGFTAYLRKPLKQSALFDALATAVDAGGTRAAAVPAVSFEPLGGVVVLVAEDNAVNRKLALQQLKKLGYRAHAVADGLEALEALASQQYDVILMDCQMPGLDGFDATRAIRRAEAARGAHVPIVAMTANALEGDREACLAAGMDDYLAKPVQLAELRAVLERFTTGVVGAR